MRARIDEIGTLIIEPNEETEVFLLKCWIQAWQKREVCLMVGGSINVEVRPPEDGS